MQTFTSRAFWPLEPHPDDISVEDIAHSLGMKCRYNGHCRIFYSVGEHSCRVHDLLVSWSASKQECFWGLFHDAGEAYGPDVPRPLKKTPLMAPFRAWEKRVQGVVMGKFGLSPEEPAAVKRADNVLLASEKEMIMGPPPRDWLPLPPPIVMTPPIGWDPSRAKEEFRTRAALYGLRW